MSERTHLMVDLETMATGPQAAIVSIGACMFDPYAGPEQDIPDNDRFLQQVSLESNQRWERQLEASTIMWWMSQSDSARAGITEGTPTNLKQALVRFRLWTDTETFARTTHIWANDPDFDVVILRSAFQTCQEMWPWGFWMNRSMRTVGDLAYPDHKERKAVINAVRESVGTHHRADDDAIAQARFIAHCYKKLGLSNDQEG